MIELEFLGIGSDGQSLVLTDARGERYAVPVTDELRAAVRRDRSRLDVVADQRRPLRPGEIQALLRSGLSSAEVAQEYSLDIAHVRRFEAPVLAEQNFALQRALEIRVGGDPGGPALGDLVVDRLAARGVDPDSLAWTARRDPDAPWQICLTFVQGAAEHGAHWTMPGPSSVEAVDQEAKWLTETVAPAPVSAVFTPLPASLTDTSRPNDLSAREALVDQLNAARGHASDAVVPLDEEDEDAESPSPEDPVRDSISARIYSLAQARSRETTPSAQEAPATPAGGDAGGDVATDTPGEVDVAGDRTPSGTAGDEPSSPADEGDRALPGLESVIPTHPATEHRRGSRRRSVPSWDEIVFGSKS